MREIFLEGKDLLKVYGPTTAVNHLDINVYQARFYPGRRKWCRKSTLTKILSGVISSDSGSIKILGEEINLNKYTPATARSKESGWCIRNCPYARI